MIELKKLMPKAFKEFEAVCGRLEKHYKDMQDLEFTIQNGHLWMLQTRSGKRTAAAAVKIAVDMTRERLIGQKEALMRVNPSDLDQLLHPSFDPAARRHVIGT
ncbi:MAG TPA: pyruvate, phosphate dikinase, partial [Candidatus Handelsmanbacteria bacterium]|nr:pyruvate, phosphate dikinase [Candidatus Handelsmanbacteria bacterium]